jgi:hypothetical protein
MNAFDAVLQSSGVMVVTAIFTIVFIFSYLALAYLRAGGASRFALALCVAVLSVTGMFQIVPKELSNNETQGFGNMIDAILIPYTALGLTLPLLLILFFVGKLTGKDKNDSTLHDRRFGYGDAPRHHSEPKNGLETNAEEHGQSKRPRRIVRNGEHANVDVLGTKRTGANRKR